MAAVVMRMPDVGEGVVETEIVAWHVAVGAPVSGKGLPLVVMSHGNGGWFGGHYDTAAALALCLEIAERHPGSYWQWEVSIWRDELGTHARFEGGINTHGNEVAETPAEALARLAMRDRTTVLQWLTQHRSDVATWLQVGALQERWRRQQAHRFDVWRGDGQRRQEHE